MKRYEIKTCCGDHMEYIKIETIPGEHESDSEHRALVTAEYPIVRCDACYDQAYKARRVDKYGKQIF